MMEGLIEQKDLSEVRTTISNINIYPLIKSKSTE
jgi:hypothetical protein